MDLFAILACPNCRVHVERQGDALHCPQCRQSYPIVNGVPVLFPDGSVPHIQHESELALRDNYLPWVNRLILQSLLDDQIVLEIGSGNVTLDDPCVIRMDVTLSPYVDLVADAHALPFLPGSLDYIFSLAVFEHLRNPFQAAESIYSALKDGGYIYHECNFVFAYHGYPHHYFNASLQGLEQVFQHFTPLRSGVATYQMPSFALQMVLASYLKYSHAHEYPHGQQIVALLNQVLQADLMQYDIYFSEAEALNIAAGTYWSGYKQAQPGASLIPAPIRQVWERDPELRRRFPNPHDLTRPDNLLAWAMQNCSRQTGGRQYPEIAAYLETLPRFNKRGPDAPWDRRVIRGYEFQAADFGAIGFDPQASMAENAQTAHQRQLDAYAALHPSKKVLAQRAWDTLRQEGAGALMSKVGGYLRRSRA